jgi:hypothetical protein
MSQLVESQLVESQLVESQLVESQLVERELYRKEIYEREFILWSEKTLAIKKKEISSLLIRYIFNKIITMSDDDDPVFIKTHSPIAENQLKKDFKYLKVKISPDEFIQSLEKKFSHFHEEMNREFPTDSPVYLVGDKIIYKKNGYNDISSLAKNNPCFSKHALCLNIRYNYLRIENHGLARIYTGNRDEGFEAFSSAFNRYFDSFCSCFPDLEHPFGSVGSFFKNKKWHNKKIYVNPPFDESLMSLAMTRITEVCESFEGDEPIKFICTFPNWCDFESLENFKKSKYVNRINTFEKGTLPFVDYMRQDNRQIFPCDIVEIFTSSKNCNKP